MRRVYELVCTVAEHDVPVLLTGETGTGKELTAREIHDLGGRRNAPFLVYDCAALSELGLDGELFSEASGGTIFLDEVQNASLALQARLLRVVEQGEVRTIAACNIDLRQAVKAERFRADFYYRLGGFPIELPPLRERTDDILPLTHHFIATVCRGLRRAPPAIDRRVERALLAYDWPGNLRELKNTIERSLLLTPPGQQQLLLDSLPAEVRNAPDRSNAKRGLDAQVHEFERQLIQTALDRNGGIIRRAARELEVNAITLARKMRRLGLDKAG